MTKVIERDLEGDSYASGEYRRVMDCVRVISGDSAALKLCFTRILASRHGRSIDLKLPPIKSAGDGAAAMARILEAVGTGEITPDEATQLSEIAAKAVKAFEAVEWERRIKRLEELNPPT